MQDAHQERIATPKQSTPDASDDADPEYDPSNQTEYVDDEPENDDGNENASRTSAVPFWEIDPDCTIAIMTLPQWFPSHKIA